MLITLQTSNHLTEIISKYLPIVYEDYKRKGEGNHWLSRRDFTHIGRLDNFCFERLLCSNWCKLFIKAHDQKSTFLLVKKHLVKSITIVQSFLIRCLLLLRMESRNKLNIISMLEVNQVQHLIQIPTLLSLHFGCTHQTLQLWLTELHVDLCLLHILNFTLILPYSSSSIVFPFTYFPIPPPILPLYLNDSCPTFPGKILAN